MDDGERGILTRGRERARERETKRTVCTSSRASFVFRRRRGRCRLLSHLLNLEKNEKFNQQQDVAGDVALAVKDADAVGATAAAAGVKEARGAEAGAPSSSSSRPRGMLLGTDNDELYSDLGAAAEKFSREEGLRSPGDAIGLKEYLTSPTIMKNRNFFILIGTCACW